MRARKHHNNDGRQRIRSGSNERGLKAIAKRLGIKYGDASKPNKFTQGK